MLRVGILGTGGISAAHIAAWSRVPEATVVAVCDIRPEKAEEAAAKTGGRVYLDGDAMLAEAALDVVDICLPTYLHADWAVKALTRGIHTLMEKPISLHAGDVRRVYDAAMEHDARVMVAQVLRFWREYLLVKEAYDSGRYGRLLSGSMTRLGNTPRWSWDGWMTDPARSGLVPFDLHIHDLDFMVHAFGVPKDLQCNRARAHRQDYINAVYAYDGFFIASEATWYDGAYPFRAGFRFQFEGALMEYAGGTLRTYLPDERVETLDPETGAANGINLPDSDAYYNEIRYFTDCVLAGKPCDRVQPAELEAVLSLIARLDG